MNFEKPEKSKFWKNGKKLLEISSFYICLPKATIIWGTVPEIWSETIFFLLILDHFLPFYPSPHSSLITQRIKILRKWKKALETSSFTQVSHKWQSYDIWFLRYQLQQTDFFVILGHFLPFYSPNSPKNENIKKMKESPGNIIILHKCTKNHDYMLYFSWDLARDGCNCCFSFWASFVLLPL